MLALPNIAVYISNVGSSRHLALVDRVEAAMWMRPRGRHALADALARCRRAAGLTQDTLAKQLRVNRTTVLDMEAGRNPALNRWSEAMSLLGYDIVIVPRAAKVTVQEVPAAQAVTPALPRDSAG
jgi:DNA-binding XRE family transcriptional regulator